jgi:3-oxo-5-alpha-steroid 4-dehydrogenase 1
MNITTEGLELWAFVEPSATEATLYWRLLVAWALLGLVAFVLLLFMPAPYGRFAPKGIGTAGVKTGVPSKIAWAIMESPTVWLFGLIFLMGSNKGIVSIAFLLIWNGHYLYRTLLYPLRLRSEKRVPVYIVCSALLFNSINVYLQAGFLFRLAAPYPPQWLGDVRFWAGGVLFALGFATHVWTDSRLRRLRSDRMGEYQIPRGGLFEWVSCPNYLGETLQWFGWAMLTWSAGGWVFAWWTLANLVPRARSHHAWYQRQFPDYPKGRKAMIPLIV